MIFWSFFMEMTEHMKRNLSVKKTIRFKEEEYEFLEKKMTSLDASGRNYKNFSQFARECLLSNNGYHSTMIKHQLADIRFEIHKIGVNVNQIAKKVNGGFGTHTDIKELKDSLEKIETAFEEYEDKVAKIWQSQS